MLACEWRVMTAHIRTYRTQCGRSFYFEKGDIKSNTFQHCPYCDGMLKDKGRKAPYLLEKLNRMCKKVLVEQEIDWNERGVLHDELKCEVLSVVYDFVTRIGTLHIPFMNCCHMPACVNMFEGIDAEVVRINTFAGGAANTIYIRDDDGWVARVPADGKDVTHE